MNDCTWCTERQGKFLKEGFRQVHTGPGNPGKPWNFILTFSRTFKLKKRRKRLQVLESLGNLLYNCNKIFRIDFKILQMKGFKVKFRALEKLV